MKYPLAALVAGFVFGVGLMVSGMTQAHKVIGFLDVFGAWDPSLIFVMVGAIALHLIALRFILRRKKPVLDQQFHLPDAKSIDSSLIMGAGIFGVGWGLAGFCPGPAVVLLASGASKPLVFVVSMLFGMLFHKIYADRPKKEMSLEAVQESV